MRVVWIIALPIAAGTTLLAERFIVTMYGEAYARASTALQILIWTLPLLSLTTLCGSLSIVLHRERSVARLNTLNAVVNVSLNFWAIKQFGIVGAAVLTLVTELVGLGQFSFVLRDVIPARSIARIMIAPVLAVGLMSSVVYLSSSLPLIPLVACGAATYAVLLVVTGAMTVTELRGLSRFASSRLTRRPATIG
jgi:O-antigen/teichoic acid export membrane protein